MSINKYLFVSLFGAGLLSTAAITQASVDKSAIGYNALQAELGAATPTGAGVKVSVVEASWDGRASNYAPDDTDSEFGGKSFTYKSGSHSDSLHATEVGRHLFGLSTSMTPGITEVDSYYSADWRSDYLNTGSFSAPDVETSQVQNHSWISSNSSTDVLRRLDHAINRDGFTAVVGVNNWNGSGSAPSHPPLLSSSYNSIAVGLSSGRHSRGGTTADGTGRIKPDIVAPDSAVSFATPTVSSAAALLREVAGNDSSLANGLQPETVKAVLMAGATKEEFAGWDRTTTRPLDDVYGAGELNVYRSYQILTGGEQEAGTSVSQRGWDFTTTGASNASYFFDVVDNTELTDLSVLLTWNRQAGPGALGWLTPDSSLANLDLSLTMMNGSDFGSILDISQSAVDNVEHIYFDSPLSTGRYALTVSSDTLGTEYALAWHGTTVLIPEPGGLLIILIGAASIACRRPSTTFSRVWIGA